MSITHRDLMQITHRDLMQLSSVAMPFRRAGWVPKFRNRKHTPAYTPHARLSCGYAKPCRRAADSPPRSADMTWVIAACPGTGGYAITVSDIQITLLGRTFDLVRKAYRVGPHLIGGFAGSVKIGFELLASISRFLKAPPGAPSKFAWKPAQVARDWALLAKKVFQKADVAQRKLGSQFVLVGTDPIEEVGIPGHARPYLCKFSAPDFEPDITPGGRSIISIGSGSEIPEYIEAIRDLLDPSSRERGHFLRLEDNIYARGRGIGYHMALTDLLEKRPVVGISFHVHTQVATREGCTLMQNKTGMPRVAQNWNEFVEMIGALDIDPASAVA
jgi:hypothetical protein